MTKTEQIDLAVQHMAWLLKDDEIELLRVKLYETLSSNNMFYNYRYIDFYYDKLSSSDASFGDGLEFDRCYLQCKFLTESKEAVINLMPFVELGLEVGTRIEPDTKDCFFKHNPKNKYHIHIYYMEIVAIVGDNLYMEFPYHHYGKDYIKKEVWSKAETIKEIYRNNKFLVGARKKRIENFFTIKHFRFTDQSTGISYVSLGNNFAVACERMSIDKETMLDSKNNKFIVEQLI